MIGVLLPSWSILNTFKVLFSDLVIAHEMSHKFVYRCVIFSSLHTIPNPYFCPKKKKKLKKTEEFYEKFWIWNNLNFHAKIFFGKISFFGTVCILCLFKVFFVKKRNQIKNHVEKLQKKIRRFFEFEKKFGQKIGFWNSVYHTLHPYQLAWWEIRLRKKNILLQRFQKFFKRPLSNLPPKNPSDDRISCCKIAYISQKNAGIYA